MKELEKNLRSKVSPEKSPRGGGRGKFFYPGESYHLIFAPLQIVQKELAKVEVRLEGKETLYFIY